MGRSLLSMHFKNIEKLRGFAAISVLVLHVVSLTAWTAFPTKGPLAWFRWGWMGVDLFFVISGVVVTYSALGLYEKDPDNYRSAYWQRRLSRILPLYLLTLFICLIALVPDILFLPNKDIALHIGTHLIFIHNLFPVTTGSINGPNWSIGIEMQFYLLIALLIPWLAKARPLRILVTFTLVAWIYRALVVLILVKWHISDYKGIPYYMYFHYVAQFPGTLDEFGFGIFLCRLLIADDPKSIGLGSLSVLLKNGWLALLAAVLSTGAMLYGLSRAPGYWNVPFMAIFFRTFIGLAFCLVVLAAVRFPLEFPRLIGRPLDYLGDISYGIYLWQILVIVSLKKINSAPGVPFLLRTLVLVLALSAISWHFMEKPFMQRFRQPRRGMIPAPETLVVS